MSAAVVAAPTRWLSWSSADPIAAVLVVADDGARSCWANRRLVHGDAWPAVDRWEANRRDSVAPVALLTEADLAAMCAG